MPADLYHPGYSGCLASTDLAGMTPGVTTLTRAQYELLVGQQSWQIIDVPRYQWDKFPDWMGKAAAIMSSGDMTKARILNGEKAVGGVDWLRAEDKPKPGEPEGNAYHYVLLERKDGGFDMLGPFSTEARVNHWFGYDDLATYVSP